MMEVVIPVDDDAAPLVITTMKGTSVAIALTTTATMPLTVAPANETFSWTMMMMTIDDDDDAGHKAMSANHSDGDSGKGNI